MEGIMKDMICSDEVWIDWILEGKSLIVRLLRDSMPLDGLLHPAQGSTFIADLGLLLGREA
jgi:hypothetical protein